jgi:hypothetical protein
VLGGDDETCGSTFAVYFCLIPQISAFIKKPKATLDSKVYCSAATAKTLVNRVAIQQERNVGSVKRGSITCGR